MYKKRSKLGTKDVLTVMLHKINFLFVWLNHSSGQSWSWSYGSWIYNYLCNQWISPL